MTDVEKAIANLLIPNGKPSPKMTHALKFIGDGSMQNGLTRIAEYFIEVGKQSGLKKGLVVGGIGGFTIASVLFAIYVLVKNKIDKDRKLEAEGVAILQGLEEGMLQDEENPQERNEGE